MIRHSRLYRLMFLGGTVLWMMGSSTSAQDGAFFTGGPGSELHGHASGPGQGSLFRKLRQLPWR